MGNQIPLSGANGRTAVGINEEFLFGQVKSQFIVHEEGGPTVQDRAEILHISDLFVRWSFRGTDDLKHFAPETLKYFRVE